MIELGDYVEDKITGFKGIVTGITKHLTGCDRASVQAPLTDDGKYGECYALDFASLKILKKQKVKSTSVQSEKPGGPATKVQRI